MSKIVDWCPICGKPIFIYENQAFKRQSTERAEKDQSGKILLMMIKDTFLILMNV